VSSSVVRTHYLNADFDLGLRPRPRQIEQPALVRQARELSVQALLGTADGDAALVRAEVPGEFVDHLRECGIETPRLLAHPEIDPAARFEPFGWSAEAIALNERHERPAPHPPLETIRRVNARSFGRRLEAEISADVPAGAVVEHPQELEVFLSGMPRHGEWVVKAEHGHSALANRRLRGPLLEPADRRFIDERLAEDDRLVVERWLPRERDYCVVFEVPFDAAAAHVHETANTSGGVLVGVRFDPAPDDLAPRRELLRAAERIAARLAEEGFFGPACADGFTWKENDRLRLRALVDLNGRRPMSDRAYHLWRRLDPRSTLYYRFFNRRKLRFPRDLAQAVAALGDRGYDRRERRGILLASPLRVGLDGEWRPTTKQAVIFVGRGREEVQALEGWFRRRFEV
jgi:hypothetical protein